MQMTIQITDSATGTTMTASNPESGATASAGNSNDGGAPTFSESGTDITSPAAGQLDIGGPPQWLTDGLSKDKAAAATGGKDSKADVTDGGGAPSFS